MAATDDRQEYERLYERVCSPDCTDDEINAYEALEKAHPSWRPGGIDDDAPPLPPLDEPPPLPPPLPKLADLPPLPPYDPVVDLSHLEPIDQLWTWINVLFNRAKACGVEKPVFEFRMPKTQKGTVSGYFDSTEKMTELAAAWDRLEIERDALYATLNPCSPELLARANNKVKQYAKVTTDDKNIARRTLLGFDYDADRPAGISSTDAEHDAALARAREGRDWLTTEFKFPDPLLGDSGNGGHLVYAIDLENTDENTRLVENCLAAMAAKFPAEKKGIVDGEIRILVDTSVSNAARIWKLYGTRAGKGDTMPDRPHRIARILSMPKSETLRVVPREALESLAATVAKSAPSSKAKSTSTGAKSEKSKGVHEPDLDVPAWLEKHGLKITRTKTDYGKKGDGTLYELECCPMDPQHSNSAACVIKFGNGVVTAKCHHNGCTGKGWREWREKVGDPLPARKFIDVETGVERYTEEEIASFAKKADCTVPAFAHRWMIQKANSVYVFRGADGYSPPLLKTELGAALRKRDLARVPSPFFAPPHGSPAGIDWWVPVGGDKMRLKNADEMLRDYATVADKVIASMMLAESYYDPAGPNTFYEAVCRRRPIAPAYDPQIDKWLRLLGGDSAEKLLDWVATFDRLDRVTCALYIHGPKDAGKTLFAIGLAQAWGHAPTPLRSLTGNFNSALTNCPLVFADEEIPANMTSGFLRKMIGTTSRELTRKFIPEAELLGAVRVIIAANTPDLLKFDDEDFTEDDIDAVAARILYVKPTPGKPTPDGKPTTLAGDYLRSIGGRTGTEGWVENGAKIAAHALWLRDNRVVKPGSRFLVEGEISTMHRRLATHGSIRGLVIEWIAKSIMRTVPAMDKNPGIVYGGGKLYVNAGYIKSTWNVVDDKRSAPSLKKIGMALRPLAQGERRLPFGADGRRDFYDLRLLPIYEAMRELQLGTIEDYKQRIEAPRAYLDALPDAQEAPPRPDGVAPNLESYLLNTDLLAAGGGDDEE